MNQIKKIIQMLGVKQKDVSKYLGISSQSLNVVYKSENPRKYNNQIANFLGINVMFLTKNEITSEDKNEILKQYYQSKLSKSRSETIMFSEDEILDLENFLQDIESNSFRDYKRIVLEMIASNMEIPKLVFEWGSIGVQENKIIIKNNSQYDKFSFDYKMLEKVIFRGNKINHKIYVLEFTNGLTIEIDIILK
ncbi:MAG: hypothetical protein FNP40_10820 [Dehalobacter sp. 4CP]|uniref:hypothetical protein n=1 Tax=Dehalobacter sp. CP TaxID=2594474 RepID=UPI0013C9328C|nr:hypothetical protein [Dehalobacter sp.]NBJ16030.1 hypothetical protein [Dehalobacter sp. 4CP]